MSFLWNLLSRRAGDEALPPDIGPDSPELEDEELSAEPIAPQLQLTDADFRRAAELLDVSKAVVQAVAEIESAGRGFLPSGRAALLYEAHIFDRETNGRHRNVRDSRERALSVPTWDRSLYGPAGEWQWDGRLAAAAEHNWIAAHRSASYGLFQVLGTNHWSVGSALQPPRWEHIGEFVDAMNSGAGAHLDAFVGFVRANRLDGMLRNHNWPEFARRYNGPAFARNQYHTRLAAAYRKFSRP